MEAGGGINWFYFIVFAWCSYVTQNSAFILLPSRQTKDKQWGGVNDTGVASRVGDATATAIQERLHPGIIASVVIVSLMSVGAGIFIIRKYCFQRSSVTYRYSVLRGMEDQSTPGGHEDRDAEIALQEEESDEDLLD